MINIVHLIGYLGRGGDTSVVLDVMNGMDPEKYHFDFITHKGTTDMELVERLRRSGSRVYVLEGDVRKLGIPAYYRQIRKLLRDAPVKYDILHTHTSMQSGVALLAAKHEGIQLRVCHSHVTSIQRKSSALKILLSTPVFKAMIFAGANRWAACSRMAGDFLYGAGTEYRVIYNGVDIEKYKAVSGADAVAMRSAFSADDDCILVGHVARVGGMKNQSFDIELAKKLAGENVKFVIVGKGNEFDAIKLEADKLDGSVIMTGQRSDVPVLMKAFDCVLLPSLPGEGFPVTIIEAQSAGCSCIISNYVTGEVEVGLGLVKQLPLDVDAWAKEIMDVKKNRSIDFRNSMADELIKLGFGKSSFTENWLALYEGVK